MTETREKVRQAIEQFKAQGEHYVKSEDVINAIDVTDTSGKRSHIGALLNDLADARDDIEEWGRGSRNLTWRLEPEEQ